LTLLFLLLLPFVALADQLAPTVRQAVRCWIASRVRAKRKVATAGASCKSWDDDSHAWGPWSDPVPSASGVYKVQERRCTECNLLKDRVE
jgi:hypothetical protein